MFEQLFRYPGVIERYRAGPLADDRLRYLTYLADTGASTQTLLVMAHRQLALVQLLEVREDQRVLGEQLDAAIERWAQPRPRRRRLASAASVADFRGAVTRWLDFVGRLETVESPPRPSAPHVAEFADWMRERGLAEATIRGRCFAAAEFLDWCHADQLPLGSLTIADVDRAVAAKSEQGRCGRIALHGYLKRLRAFFRFAGAQGWCPAGLAEAVVPPRLYAGETIPAGLAWDDVQQLLASTEGARPVDRRDRAAFLLLAVYGLRAGEVCSLRLDDVDWEAETLRVRRPKPGRTHLYPLSRPVGEALLDYLRESRPRRAERTLFLTLCAPIRPLSPAGLSCRVHRRLRLLGIDAPKRGAHALRHNPESRIIPSCL
ncbi:MAG: tyrosine-type recombinase/integrase [Bryobacterales bacterium]|nr:tyrosine-type recombinase/integrase [Bryobacterales bacterium]